MRRLENLTRNSSTALVRDACPKTGCKGEKRLALDRQQRNRTIPKGIRHLNDFILITLKFEVELLIRKAGISVLDLYKMPCLTKKFIGYLSF